ncbi:MAG TPA: molybdate ABC transporter substrate-binding protein [Acinetobacter junii]|nr:molybdate ABC transporter substrate-binding protein [Acinetobacter junii]
MIQKYRYALAVCIGLFSHAQAFAVDKVTVYAAASLTNAINELDVIYEQKNKVQIQTSYAGSSTLAKQIEAGAPADIFISADVQWMDYLQKKQLVSANDRVNLLGNRLVVIAPKARPIKLKIDKSFDFTRVVQGKWCTGDTKSVPVGKYAKQALTSIGWWDNVSTRLVETEDVRAALNFVARGECQLGIVYATDAAISKNVVIVGTFLKNTHQAIIYPIGLVKKNTESMNFYKFLQSSQATKVFKKYGFSVLK